MDSRKSEEFLTNAWLQAVTGSESFCSAEFGAVRDSESCRKSQQHDKINALLYYIHRLQGITVRVMLNIVPPHTTKIALAETMSSCGLIRRISTVLGPHPIALKIIYVQ